LSVLIVEDEWLVRISSASALAEAGFTVTEIDRTDQAIAHLRDRARQIHALFTDIHVPGPIDGLALAHLSRRTWPWVQLLVVSGRAKPAAHELPEGARFLGKPYETDQVIFHLREMGQAARFTDRRHRRML
jgi:two-component system, response regulator PdtaR